MVWTNVYSTRETSLTTQQARKALTTGLESDKQAVDVMLPPFQNHLGGSGEREVW